MEKATCAINKGTPIFGRAESRGNDVMGNGSLRPVLKKNNIGISVYRKTGLTFTFAEGLAQRLLDVS